MNNGDAPLARLCLVRHGRTELNAAGVLRGRLDPPLDRVGRLQAERLGAFFARVPVALIVASPLTRARQTAAAISTATGLGVEIDEGLLDRDYGEWAGQPRRTVERRFGSLDAAPGVEPMAAVGRRAAGALERLAHRAGDKLAVAVAHDAVIRAALVNLIPGLGPDPDAVALRTGSWTSVQRSGDGWSAPVLDAVAGDGREP